MKLIESKAEYIPQEEGLEGIYKMIELAGRTAYHSLDKITPTSAKDFVGRMIKSKHGAALEHGTAYFNRKVDYSDREYLDFEEFFDRNPYSKVDYEGGILYVVTNFRVLEENFNLKDFWKRNIQYLCSPTEFHEKRYTIRFTCSRAIAQELTRHRKFSFLMESQRYINYSKERHGGEITYIKPSWLNVPIGIVYWHDGICWRVQQDENNPMEWFSVKPQEEFSEKEAQVASTYFDALSYAEKRYFFLLRKNCQPQQARDVLPNATKTELIMTGFSSDWARLFELRLYESTGKVAPDMKELMKKTWKEFENYGITRDLERYIKL